MNSQYNDTGNDSDLRLILKCACFGINADILLFVSYITDNIRILRLILNMANELTGDWPEFNFKENMPDYLRSEKKHIVSLPTEEEREKERSTEINAERDMESTIQLLKKRLTANIKQEE